MDIDKIFNEIYELPQTSKLKLEKLVIEVEYSKGHILLKAEKIESKIYFIKHGIVRAYANTPEKEVTFWFGKEGDTVFSLKSYVENQKGYEDIELLEDSKFYELDNNNLQILFKEDIHIANWGRKLAELNFILTEQRLIQHQFLSATERYQELTKNSPNLIQRVQLGHIASYLGISQVSLSRIRAKVK